MKYYLCITPFFPTPSSFRGPYVLDQVKAIERNSDYKVVVLRGRSLWHSHQPDYQMDGIDVYWYTNYSLPSNLLPNRLTDRLNANSIMRTLQKKGISLSNVEICHAHVTTNGALALCLKHHNPGIKVVVQHHGFDVMGLTDGRLANYKWHKRWCERRGATIVNRADINVGVSKSTLDYVRRSPGVDMKSEYVLYNGVDTSIFKPDIDEKPKSIFTIGCIGNFWGIKDQITLIKAAEKLVNKGRRNFKVIFIGTGATLDECKRYVADHKLTDIFEFRTEVMHDLLPDFYRTLNLFVLPSYWEAFGCVYTEAYACGVPFIGVKGQGIAEIVDPEWKDRCLIEKGDTDTLTRLIETSMDESELKLPALTQPIDIDYLVSDYLTMLATV